MLHYKRNTKKDTGGMIPTRFKTSIDKKKRRPRELDPESKVVAALSKCLTLKSTEDNVQYYIAGDEMYCPSVGVTKSRTDAKKGDQVSYTAKGRFKAGRVIEGGLSFSMIEFSIKFRDSVDEMNLPDLLIEEADMKELDKNAPLKG